ncbi:M3 family oligoendopeptidase [Clostridium bovifaecis]|uniref:M3 family oligoendopeptidase n=1 Tax=Clostridium bovifaecis TaxID=2184719 RepID=A0A6I6EPA7_9CLOT|nr:M3 family oligoendopeptidase [Clostridium bovifaecis]
MDMKWNLDNLYASFESKEFSNDIKSCEKHIEEFKEWVDRSTKNNEDAAYKIEEYIGMKKKILALAIKLLSFSELTLSVDTKNRKAKESLEIVEGKLTELVEPNAKFEKWLGKAGNLDSIIASSELLKEHNFYLKEIVEKSKYLLSDKEEAIVAKMKNTGSNAWTKLKDFITSTLLVDIEVDGEEKKLPLSLVRNMAHDKDASIRKRAYEAELKAYGKIDDTAAACLNGIKGEVITVSKLRGYKSPLEETLIKSRIDEKILDSMLTAMKESMPIFWKFYRRKGEMLGNKNGLPFYDLFAPVGEVNMKFTYDEAKEFIVKNFRTFSERLADFATKAFEENWIDAEPREGKVGGAFCENIHPLGESRIMSNFSGSFSDVVTLAHELGHGYHGECLKNESILNSEYPMPIAETASTFCETIIKQAAIKNSSREEAFTILENEISDAGQVIVDIYSRFLFESELFKRREESSLSTEELKEIMLNAQKEAYGDGLDEKYLHPYMWVNKPHYYYADTNFYNFPYAFGLLFSKGLYAEYLKRGKSFVEDYDRLLEVTGKNNLRDVAALMGINIASIDFWRSSLKLVEDDIEKFIELSQ